MKQMAIRKFGEYAADTIWLGGPKTKVSAPAVMKVEVARTEAFKRIVRGFLLISNVVQTPSSAESTTAAAPP